jgi:hypothetical protein
MPWRKLCRLGLEPTSISRPPRPFTPQRFTFAHVPAEPAAHAD